MTISPFGWHDNTEPAIDAANLAAMHAAAGAYADGLAQPDVTDLGTLGAGVTISLSEAARVTADVWYTATMTENVTITIEDGYSTGSSALIVLFDSTGGHTITFTTTNDGGTATYEYGRTPTGLTADQPAAFIRLTAISTYGVIIGT